MVTSIDTSLDTLFTTSVNPFEMATDYSFLLNSVYCIHDSPPPLCPVQPSAFALPARESPPPFNEATMYIEVGRKSRRPQYICIYLEVSNIKHIGLDAGQGCAWGWGCVGCRRALVTPIRKSILALFMLSIDYCLGH